MPEPTYLLTSKERIVSLRIYELGARLHQDMTANKIITRCWEPDCHLFRLHNLWFEFHEAGDYPRISQGICPKHAAKLEAEIQQIIAAMN